MGTMDNSPPDDALLNVSLRVERKVITLSLKENPRGRFLRIVEDVGGRRDAVIVPAAGLEELRQALEAVIAADAAKPRPPSLID
ncbi:MAG: DNA-binding protein [Verrucomicrobia bacterium]|nr:MAG: DNA-binding protein [Verrucomicrobiota bacterium]